MHYGDEGPAADEGVAGGSEVRAVIVSINDCGISVSNSAGGFGHITGRTTEHALRPASRHSSNIFTIHPHVHGYLQVALGQHLLPRLEHRPHVPVPTGPPELVADRPTRT